MEEKKDLLENYQSVKDQKISVEEFCGAVDVPVRSFYFWQSSVNRSPIKIRGRRSPPKNKLSPGERKEVVSILLRSEWADYSPREVYYKLLDEEVRVIASPSTFYRVAKSDDLLTRRVKNAATTKCLNRIKPSLVATESNQVWSWDVSQIRSDVRLSRYYLYVIIDIWDRFVVGWVLEAHEQTDLALNMWKAALEDQCITGNGLVNHKDNGSIMTSREMIKFVDDAKMVDSYSRAGVSDDNPFSESLFGTIKTFRTFPDTFESLESGREYFKKYFDDYNHTFKHSGIQFLTPAERRHGEEEKILSLRNKTIATFYENNSHRYAKQAKKFEPILEVRIN